MCDLFDAVQKGVAVFTSHFQQLRTFTDRVFVRQPFGVLCDFALMVNADAILIG